MPLALKDIAYELTRQILFSISTGDALVNPSMQTNDWQYINASNVLTNLATLPVVSPASSRWVKINLSSGEMAGLNGKMAIQGIDTAGTPLWKDKYLTFEVPDNNDESSNVTQIAGSTDAATKLKNHALRTIPVTFAAGGTTTTAVLALVDGVTPSSTNDLYNGAILAFESGVLKDARCQVTDYDGPSKTLTITQVPSAPDSATPAVYA